MPLSRIYQGRVTKLKLLTDGKATDADPVTPDQLQAILSAHHQTFQDAVNYHQWQMLRLAKDPATPLGKIRVRLLVADVCVRRDQIKDQLTDEDTQLLSQDVWNDFTRNGLHRPGMGASITRLLGISASSSLAEAFEAADQRFNSAEVKEGIYTAAIAALLEDLGGDGAIQQGGRDYLPRFCDPTYGGGFPRSTTSLAKKAAQKDLPTRLYDPATLEDLPALQAELDFAQFANANLGIPALNKARCVALLTEALEEFTTANTLPAPDRLRLAALASGLPEDFTLPSYRGASVKLALRPRFLAFLLFKYLEATPLTFGLLRDAHPAPKTAAKAPSAKTKTKTKPSDALLQFGDDPVKLARGSKRVVYPGFTSLADWSTSEIPSLAWNEFDIAAFKEALKTINQVKGRTEEREEKRATLLDTIHYLEHGGKPPRSATGEDDDEDVPATLAGDDRLPRFKALLATIKTQAGPDAEDYGADNPDELRKRAIRGHKDLIKLWNQDLKRQHRTAGDDQGRDPALLAILKTFQKDHSDDMGWALLFEHLTRPEHWDFWRTPDEATSRQWRNDHRTFDFLKDYVAYSDAQVEAVWLAEPIRFTPADGDHSRRLFMFSDACKMRKQKGQFRHLPNATAMIVPVAYKSRLTGRYEKCRVRLDYAAPRLQRDELRNPDGGATLTSAPWTQPMMAALGVPAETTSQNLSKAAVALMPDRGRDGAIRFLLNFPITLEEAGIAQHLASLRGRALDWDAQSVAFGKGDARQAFYLCWPGFDKAVKETIKPWWQETNTFRTLAVDLGVRTAGAAAIVKAYQGPALQPRDRLLGHISQQPWHGAVERRITLRLPGEDLRDPSRHTKEEPAGEAGRPASMAEVQAARQFILALDLHPDHLGLTAERWHIGDLNAKLIVALRRAFGHQRLLLRWCRQLTSAGIATTTQDEISTNLTRAQEEQTKDQAAGAPPAVAAWTLFLDQLTKLPTTAAKLSAVTTAVTALDGRLRHAVVELANGLIPLRYGYWTWQQSGKHWQLTLPTAAKGNAPNHIRHQGGLSMKRLEAITDFRKLLQSFNRLCGLPPGAELPTGKEIRNQPVPDPSPALSAKLEAMKEQRVNQTAHAILAEALGLELRPHTTDPTTRRQRDLHGEYISKRPPVDFIVIEDLSRYRTTQGRTRQENTRLMQWSHRAVSAKLKMLCEPYGLTVLETPAAYSSRFCSLTGQPGFRGNELTAATFQADYGWKQALKRAAQKPTERDAQCVHQAQTLLLQLPDKASLFLPKPGGQMFLPSGAGSLQQADLNAAVNLAFRAISAPDQFRIHQRIRSEWKRDHYCTRETRQRFGPTHIPITLAQAPAATANEQAPESLDAKPNFFYLAGPLTVPFDHAHLSLPGSSSNSALPLVSGRALWKTVNDTTWQRAWEANHPRLRKGLPPAAFQDHREWCRQTFPHFKEEGCHSPHNTDDHIPM